MTARESTTPRTVATGLHQRGCRRGGPKRPTCGGVFWCTSCGRKVGWCRGCADDFPDYCDDCAVACMED